jgi:hypothetical protein
MDQRLTPDEPPQNIERRRIKVGAQERLRFVLPYWVAHQNVTDRHTVTGMVPYRGGGDDLEQSFAAAIPPAHQQRLPASPPAGQALLQAGRALADDRRAPESAAPAQWQRPMQRRVEPQAGDHGDPGPHLVEEVDRCEAGVGDTDDMPRVASPEMLPSVGLLPHVICSPPGFGGASMRRISMARRDELVAVVAERYARSARKDRSRILDEFTAVSGLHRKHAMRLLRMRSEPSGPHRRRRVYDDAVREALILVWEASDRVCGKRLRPLIPILVESMERHGHLHLDAWPMLFWRGSFARSMILCVIIVQERRNTLTAMRAIGRPGSVAF